MQIQYSVVVHSVLDHSMGWVCAHISIGCAVFIAYALQQPYSCIGEPYSMTVKLRVTFSYHPHFKMGLCFIALYVVVTVYVCIYLCAYICKPGLLLLRVCVKV